MSVIFAPTHKFVFSDADYTNPHSVNARTFDPAQNLVWEAIETTITLKADPEKKEIRFQALYMTKKVLGSGAAKIDSIQRFAGLKEFSTRMEELGLPIVM